MIDRYTLSLFQSFEKLNLEVPLTEMPVFTRYCPFEEIQK
jgi:hypothetical protein